MTHLRGHLERRGFLAAPALSLQSRRPTWSAAGAEVLFNISASPWHLGKEKLRSEMLASLARKSRCPVAFCNLVGGNDELVFDGGSAGVQRAGRVDRPGRRRSRRIFWWWTPPTRPPSRARRSPDEESVHKALVLGLRDYMRKCGFKSAVLGLSGGIDSALVACLAVAALGAENVRGVSLPSQLFLAGQPGRRAGSGRNGWESPTM